MFIIDFDDTLMDTQGYKQSHIDALGSLGISKEMYVETYKQAYYSYTHERHAELLAERGFSYDAVVAQLEECLNQAGQFLFPDALAFLQFLRSYGEPMILLSIGVSTIQERKLALTRLHGFFDRVCTTIEPKETVMTQFIEKVHGTAWFFNDKIEESQRIHARFPMCAIVLKQCSAYSEAEYAASGFPYFKTLTEIQQYVATHKN